MHILRTLRSMTPTLQLMGGRLAGLAIAFVIPMVLVRALSPEAIGTYRLLFLIYGTLLSVAQMGMAESLYYFVPRRPAEAGRWVGNAIATLAGGGLVVGTALALGAHPIASWFRNPRLGDELPKLGLVIGLMLTATVLEIAMVSRRQYRRAAWAYGLSDLARAALLTLPALATGRLDALMMGAIAFAIIRGAFAVVYLRREFQSSLGVSRDLWSTQLAYALPFAAAVAVELTQINVHQYAVALWFAPATFAIYSIGCLQIPLVDLLATSAANVMMVSMSERIAAGESPMPLWTETVERLAFVFFPLAAALWLASRDLIVFLFTPAYAASVPVFMVSAAFVVLAAFPVDAVLRVYAETRTLLLLNLLRLAFIVAAIGWFVSRLHLPGAVLVTLVSAVFARSIGIVRCGQLMRAPLAALLPWKALAGIAVAAAAAAVPAWIVRVHLSASELVRLVAISSVYAAMYFAILYGAAWLKAPGTAAVEPSRAA